MQKTLLVMGLGLLVTASFAGCSRYNDIAPFQPGALTERELNYTANPPLSAPTSNTLPVPTYSGQ
ncbi:hypothetical protein [Ketogulonicigenium vulgare]|uniref:Lipoprotein n=1 Tax=Ketogulonicigenium vulgare (strain WSH-001) TaxID=759362 RepID=F9Y4D1_KETVW|nr:hypothetical protein [Ketogulonicigenium vulgare]AEM41744.1 hypothetical protein KVU_1905 [Ketogulonicigenium vulgare WSH-001]ALJ81852.1 hypothetical protein KVH_12180 [Ketogulonicigenium vulgare]ANW35182.1 hypothetical protein KvSKV_12095 [Ketogulonicigenium vulgare]